MWLLAIRGAIQRVCYTGRVNKRAATIAFAVGLLLGLLIGLFVELLRPDLILYT
jgi:hypothetical protein